MYLAFIPGRSKPLLAVNDADGPDETLDTIVLQLELSSFIRL
jgi:hypothetical protein